LTHAKIKKLQDDVARIRGGQDVWIPYWLKEVGTTEEIEEYRCIRRREIAELNSQPHAHGVPARRQQVIDSEEHSRAFERKLRAKYGARMSQTISEMEEEAIARARNDPEYREREGLNQKGPYD
jgi:hypothetical protein